MECLFCDGIHNTNQCLYPMTVRRCTECAAMIFCHESHTCRLNTALKPKYYRTETLASTPNSIFKVRVLNMDDINGAEIFYYNPLNEQFDQFFKTTPILSPATGGIFTMQEGEKHLTLHYEATKFVKFSFYIALLSYNGPLVALRAVITREHGVVLLRSNMDMHRANGKLSIPKPYRFNTSFIMGLKPRSKVLQLQFKTGDAMPMAANWKMNAGWTIDQHLDGENRQRSIVQNPPQQGVVPEMCHNCNKNHNIEDCDSPEYSSHCTGCLVVSFDGSNHVNPCMPINKISPIRSDLFAGYALTLFQFIYSLEDVHMFYFHKGNFSAVNPRVKLISPPVEGVITIQKLDDSQRQCIALKQTSFKRCSILFAVLDTNGVWRLRLRAVLTPNSGLLIFKITKTLPIENGHYLIPPEFRLNTIALFGMKPTGQNFYAEVRVHANKNGQLSTTNFDGYTAHVGIDVSSNQDQVSIEDALNGSTPKLKKKFNLRLYKPEPKPLSTFKIQRVVPAITR